MRSEVSRVELSVASNPHQNQRGDQAQAHEPPEPMEAVGNDIGFVLTKFACDEFVVIEFFIRIFVFGIGPVSGFVRATFGAGGGVRWNGGTAIFAVLRRFVQGGGH